MSKTYIKPKNSNKSMPLAKSQIQHLIRVTEVSGRTPERDVALLLMSITTGLRVSEIASLHIEHILNSDGTYLLEGNIPGKYTKSGKSAPLFLANKKLRKALDIYFSKRLEKNHGISKDEEYRGLKRCSKVFLTETGYGFSMSKKLRKNIDGEEVQYYACDTLERVFKRLYVRSFGEKCSFASHSGRATFANNLLDLVEKKKMDGASYDLIVNLMRSQNINAIEPYLLPTKEELYSLLNGIYKE